MVFGFELKASFSYKKDNINFYSIILFFIVNLTNVVIRNIYKIDLLLVI